MTPWVPAEAYLGALGRGDPGAMAGLFSDGAVVRSPLYGPLPAVDFFPTSFADTAQSRLTLRGVAHGSTALHIGYDTADVRPVSENEARRPSWPADQSGP